MNNHRVSGWFTETDVKHFQSGALRTITKSWRSIAYIENQKHNSFTSVYQTFRS